MRLAKVIWARRMPMAKG